jgi:hypothetical protein
MFFSVLRDLLRGGRVYYSARTPLWPLCLIQVAVSYAWWRGVYSPIHDRLNIVFWYLGWGKGRWKARVGDIITVHDIPAVVADIDHRALTVTTTTGERHHRPQCCDPWEAP